MVKIQSGEENMITSNRDIIWLQSPIPVAINAADTNKFVEIPQVSLTNKIVLTDLKLDTVTIFSIPNNVLNIEMFKVISSSYVYYIQHLDTVMYFTKVSEFAKTKDASIVELAISKGYYRKLYTEALSYVRQWGKGNYAQYK